MLKINYKQKNGITVVEMSGGLDVGAQDIIKELVDNNNKNLNENLILNFEGVSSISSSGIALLVDTGMEIKKQGRIAKLVNVRPNVLDVLQFHKILPAFNIYPDENSAKKQVLIEMKKKEQSYSRLFERIKVDLKAKFRKFIKNKEPHKNKFHSVVVKSLSMCGLFLQTDHIYSINTLLDVRLYLPVGFFKQQIKFIGKVVRVLEKDKPKKQDPGMGFCTLYMEEKERKKLEAFVNQYKES